MANIKNIYSPSTRIQLRMAFGPRASEFFWLYETLYQFSQGKLLENADGKALEFRHHFQTLSTALKMSKTPYDRRAISTILSNRLGQCSNTLGPILSQLEMRTDNTAGWVRLNKLLVPLIVDIARDKGVYMQTRPFGVEHWASFVPYPKSVEELERIKDVDPEGYEQAKTLKKSMREIDDRIREAITKDGLTPDRRSVMGRPVHTGTKEDGTAVVYDRDGDVLSLDSYLEKRKNLDQSRKNLSLEPLTITTAERDIRKVDDVTALKGDPEWFSITDDKAKQGGLTRVYECKYSEDGHRVVTSGRYQGKYLDDLINSEGRLFEGTAYSLTLPNGKPSKVPVRIDPATREPYVTVAEVVDPETQFKETKLFIKVPSGHAFTEMRLAMKSIACNAAKIKRGCIPTVSYVSIAGSNAAGFYFEPKDYNAVRRVLKSLSLSKGALNLIQGYSRDLKAIQDATENEDNLKFYEMANVKGFRSEEIKADGSKEPLRGFSRKQKECFAWLDAKGGGGIAALDTGVGKTPIAIGHMLKTIQDGGADASYDKPDGTSVATNGRFLFLCPPKLQGNIKKEVSKFVEDPRLIEDRLDVLTYDQFTNAWKKKTVPSSLRSSQPWKAMPDDALWSPEQYIAVYCDEAHQIIDDRKKSRMAAMSQFYHPRKILLTASPMASDPSDAYKLAAVANNINLTGMSPTAINARTSYNRFVNRYTDRIGGRVVKLKDDPGLQDELKTWVKRNMFYADKTEVPETNLPQLISDTNALTMDPLVESAYRTIAGSFTKVIGSMVKKFQSQVDSADTRDKSIEDVVARARVYAPLLRILDTLSNNPAEAFKELASIAKSGTTVSGVKIPPSVVKFFKGKLPISADDLDKLSNVPAPKLQRSVEILSPQMIEDGNKRAILFSDDEKFCEQTAKFLSESLPGYHAVGLRSMIKVYEGGKEVTSLLLTLSASEKAVLGKDAQDSYDFKLPIKAAIHRKFPDLPANGQYNRSYKAEDWATFAFSSIIMPDKSIKTLTLLGSVFSHGQNLQAFSTVIHLDRDSWSNENMKQRTARAWRQGQNSDVQEYTLDCVYGTEKTPQDVSLDTVRKYFQQMESVLFQQIIRESQKFDLTSGWSEVKQKSAKVWRVQNRIADLALSPYADRSLAP